MSLLYIHRGMNGMDAIKILVVLFLFIPIPSLGRSLGRTQPTARIMSDMRFEMKKKRIKERQEE